MEKASYESYSPLSPDSDLPLLEHEVLVPRSRVRRGWIRRHICKISLCAILIVSVTLNGLQYAGQVSLPRFADQRKPGKKSLSMVFQFQNLEVTHPWLGGFSGLKYDTPVVYETYTDYWSENKTLSDELWDSLESDAIAISLTDDFVNDNGIPESEGFPWDTERSLYFIKAFHHTHCLVCILRYL